MYSWRTHWLKILSVPLKGQSCQARATLDELKQANEAVKKCQAYMKPGETEHRQHYSLLYKFDIVRHILIVDLRSLF